MKPEYEYFDFEYELERGDEAFDLKVEASVDEDNEVYVDHVLYAGKEFLVTDKEYSQIAEYADLQCEGYAQLYAEDVAYCLDDEGD